MLRIYNIFFCAIIQSVVIQCLIPDLRVNKLDKKLIERKRQDTLDMCRIFNAESEKISAHQNPVTRRAGYDKRPRRYKRDVDIIKKDLSIDTARRIESIVDKLYDDVTENGEKVAYRRRDLESTGKDLMNKTIRRFNFAPAELTRSIGSLPKDEARPFTEEESAKMPWRKKWKHGIVPYFIDSKTYDSELADILIKAFDYFEKATCIRLQRLRDRPTDKNSLQNIEWLYITNPSGIKQCVHSNERKVNKGVQMVVFGYDCLSIGEIVHEIMHVLGFSHEHTRPDRDQHVTILWDNIKPGYKKYFEIRTDDTLQSIPYDYASVLHYPPRAFSKNGKVTILTESGVKLGQREGLSETDVEKIGLIYGNECVDRNRQYLLKTCPSVVKVNTQPKNITQAEIIHYFKDRLWPYGVVNYKIKDELEFSAEEKENIKTVLRHIEKETCIEFRDLTKEDTLDSNDDEQNSSINKNDSNIPNQNESENEINKDDDNDNKPNHISDAILPHGIQNTTQDAASLHASPSRRHAENILTFTRSPEPGCNCPEPGKPNGDRMLKINSDCFNSVNDLLHLFVHILGLDHQHNMHDRDSFLHILWENLTEDIRTELKQLLSPGASVGFPYDYQSVMHYPWLQIKNGVTNLMYPIWNDGWAMGHWQGLSSMDVQKINLLYMEQCLERSRLAQNPS